MIAVEFEPVFPAWRAKARELLSAEVPPGDVIWGDATQNSLFSGTFVSGNAKVHVPKAFLKAAETVALHRDNNRWTLLYRVLWRLTHGEPYLLEVQVDNDVRQLYRMRDEIGHDIHQMQAFVRFREVDGRYVAWYQPDHYIVRQIAPWFARRFGSMHWSLLTPDLCAHWDTTNLSFAPGVSRSEAPDGDPTEDLWRAYYASTFNPSRVNVDLLRQHMPERRWKTLPEAPLIQELAREATPRVRGMIGKQVDSAVPYVPVGATLPVLRDAVGNCRGCELYSCATQAVFGEGPETASIALVGEQPGDVEDLQGRAFVGPAGQVLDRALADAGLSRSELYLTNAVKHFRYEQRGKARIHKTASKAQISACQPWVEAELQLLKPKVIVCMGNTAVLSVIGRGVRLLEERGVIMPHRTASGVIATIHPSFLLRMPDESVRAQEFARFVSDLRTAREFAEAA